MGLYKVVLTTVTNKLELEQVSSRKVYLEGSELLGIPTLIPNGGGRSTTDWENLDIDGLPQYWANLSPP